MKKPECFKDLLELQKILDSNIHNVRERTDVDIRISMIAEIIEFNEETQFSHKTWKTKELDKNKMKEELIDILFFFLQYCNYYKISDEDINRLSNDFNSITGYTFFRLGSYDFLSLLNIIVKNILNDNILKEFLVRLTLLFDELCMTKQDVLDGYYEKWQKNMKRIGTEWN